MAIQKADGTLNRDAESLPPMAVSSSASASVLFSRLIRKARLRHLQLLSKIAELHSLQRAADELGMSQPAATHALGEVESILGMAVFERHSRGMRLTQSGAALMPPVRLALRAMQDCAEAAASMQDGASAMLKLGAINAGLSGLLVNVLPDFSQAHPGTVIEIVHVEPDDMLDVWDRLPIDLLVCRRPSQCPSDSEFKAILADRYCVVGRVDHPLMHSQSVGLAELATFTWMMQPVRSIAARDFSEIWSGFEGTPPLCLVNSRSISLLLAMLRQRDLLALIPYNAVRNALELGLVAEIQCELNRPLPDIGIMYRTADIAANGALARLVEAIVSTTRT